MSQPMARAEQKREEAYDALIDRCDAEEARRILRELERLLLDAVGEDGGLAVAWRGLAEVYEILGEGDRAREAQARYAAAAGLEGREAAEYALDLVRRGGNGPLIRTLLDRTESARPEAERARRAAEEAEQNAAGAAVKDEEIVELKEHLFKASVLETVPGRVRPRNNCDGTFRLTDAWLAARGIDPGAAHEFLERLSGSRCDCEVLLDAEPLGIVDSITHWKAFAVRRSYWRARALFEERAGQALARMKSGSFQEALEIWDELAERDPEDERLLLLRGNCFEALERPEEAEGSYRRLLQLNPDHGFGHFALGSLLQGTGRLEEAERVYRKGLDAEPDSAPLHCGLAAALLRSGHRDEAAGVVRSGLERAPGDEGLRRLLEACGET